MVKIKKQYNWWSVCEKWDSNNQNILKAKRSGYGSADNVFNSVTVFGSLDIIS